jgi:hypothetical protein
MPFYRAHELHLSRYFLLMLKTIIVLIQLFTGLICLSQFNDTIHYHLRFASTGTINETNEGNSYVLTNSFNFNTKRKNVVLNAAASWIYGVLEDNLTNNDFTAHGDVDFYKGTHKLYEWALVTYDKSYSLKINNRVQAGAGFAYNFIDSPYLRINVSDGFVYEKGDIIDPELGHDVYNIPRNSFRFLYRWSLKDRFVIDGTHFFQPSLLNISDYIIQSWSSISVKLRKWLSITGAVIYNKVSRTQRETLLITYGVSVEKYF